MNEDRRRRPHATRQALSLFPICSGLACWWSCHVLLISCLGFSRFGSARLGFRCLCFVLSHSRCKSRGVKACLKLLLIPVRRGRLIRDYLFYYFFISVINRPARCGGQHGGEKFIWRGILFKLADGSRGPYCGNDEAAAKGEG